MSDPYDAGLPILAELERELERVATARLPVATAAPRRRLPWRVPRRTAILVGLVCLVSASATAAVISGRSGDYPPAGPVTIARAPASYELSLRAAGRRICTALVLRETLDTACVPAPGAGGALARSAASPFRRYVYGLTGASVPEVEIGVGAERRRVNTRPVPSGAPGAASHLRFFVAAFARGRDDPVALVRIPGRERPLVDCSLGQLDARCDAR